MTDFERVLVTGSQGFLGRYMVAHLLDSQPAVEVIGVGRSPQRREDFATQIGWGDVRLPAPLPEHLRCSFASSDHRYVALDLRNRSAVMGLLSECRPDVIIHLAASLRDQPPAELLDINVQVVVELIEAIVRSGVPSPRIVFGSSGSVFGNAPGRALPLHEDDRCAPTDPYSVSKQAAENMARVLTNTYGIPAVWARIFNPIGPGLDERHLPARLARKVAEIASGVSPATLTVGNLRTTRDFIDPRDVARALHLLARSGEPGRIYNVASGVETTGQQLLDHLRSRSGLDDLRIDVGPVRPNDQARVVADTAALRSLGFELEHAVEDSLDSIFDYYRDDVRPLASDNSRASADASPPIRVSAARAHSYDVVVRAGLLDAIPTLVHELVGDARVMVLTDSGVADLYAQPLVDAMCRNGIRADLVVVPAGEASKSRDTFWSVVESLHASGLDRRGLIVNVGGGVVTDLGGHVAASYLRGVRYVNVPTTLLAQHDSAIGGKVAINTPWAKNFIGAFHHPLAVLVDPAILGTLEARHLRAGVVEAIKVAMCIDADLFKLLEEGVQRIHRFDVDVLEDVVHRASRGKAALLAPDPYEDDLRRALNLGHTYGHPLEVEMGYEILHGEAVAVGIIVATAIAAERGVCSAAYAERTFRVLEAYGMPPRVPLYSLHSACKRLDEVRLVRAGVLNFVLPIEPGAVAIVPEVDHQEIVAVIDRLVADGLLTV